PSGRGGWGISPPGGPGRRRVCPLPPTRPTRSGSLPMPADKGPPRCVLIVDDEPLVRDMLARALLGMGLQALTAGSAGEALEAVRLSAGRVALGLLDLNMPGLGRLAVLDALRGLG